MGIIRKIGIKKFLILVSFGLSLISIASGVLIAYTYNNNVKSITDSYRSTSAKSERLVSEAIDVSYINSMILSLLSQKDPDLLERDIKAINETKELFSSTVDKCTTNCGNIKKIFGEYRNQADEMINKKILLGKNAEGIEYYITVMAKTYSSILDEISAISELNN